MRGKKSVPSDFAISSDLIGICSEFVVVLTARANMSDFTRVAHVQRGDFSKTLHANQRGVQCGTTCRAQSALGTKT
jgi:hypothetical protein